jgi:hypothetical protein
MVSEGVEGESARKCRNAEVPTVTIKTGDFDRVLRV